MGCGCSCQPQLNDWRIKVPIGLPKNFGYIVLWLPLSGDNKPFLWVPHFPAPKAKWVETELWPVVGGENFLRLPFLLKLTFSFLLMLDPRVQLLRSHFCEYVSFKIIQILLLWFNTQSTRLKIQQNFNQLKEPLLKLRIIFWVQKKTLSLKQLWLVA